MINSEGLEKFGGHWHAVEYQNTNRVDGRDTTILPEWMSSAREGKREYIPPNLSFADLRAAMQYADGGENKAYICDIVNFLVEHTTKGEIDAYWPCL